MPYFRENETGETRQQPLNLPEEEGKRTEEYIESDYDDGFDELTGEEETEVSEEEMKSLRKKRFLIASGAGNIVAVVAGTLAILLLLALLFNMVGFVVRDVDRNFILFQNRM